MNQELVNNPKEIRKFGIVLGLILGLIGWLQWRHGHILAAQTIWGIAVLAEITAFCFPILLKPVMIGFLKIAHVLGWVNTRLLLILIFYLLFLPIGLLMKIFGKDMLNQKIDKSAETYWINHEDKDPNNKHYEKQF